MKSLAVLLILGSVSIAQAKPIYTYDCPNYSAVQQAAEAFNLVNSSVAKAMVYPDGKLTLQGTNPKNGETCGITLEAMGSNTERDLSFTINLGTKSVNTSVIVGIPWISGQGNTLNDFQMENGKIKSLDASTVDTGDHDFVPLIPKIGNHLKMTRQGNAYLVVGQTKSGFFGKSITCLIPDQEGVRTLNDMQLGSAYVCR